MIDQATALKLARVAVGLSAQNSTEAGRSRAAVQQDALANAARRINDQQKVSKLTEAKVVPAAAKPAVRGPFPTFTAAEIARRNAALDQGHTAFLAYLQAQQPNAPVDRKDQAADSWRRTFARLGWKL